MQSVGKRKNKSLLLKMPNLVLDSLQQNFFQLPLECFEQPQAQSKYLRAKNYSRSGIKGNSQLAEWGWGGGWSLWTNIDISEFWSKNINSIIYLERR